MPIGWVGVRSQPGAIITGRRSTRWHSVRNDSLPRPDDHRRAEVGQRRALRGERHARSRGASAGAASPGFAEAAEVDDPRDALLARHAGEGARRGLLALREVAVAAAAHRVDQVVGDVDARPRAARLSGVERVALVQLVAGSARARRAATRSRTRQRTSAPSSASAAASRPPTNPVAPVTSAFMEESTVPRPGPAQPPSAGAAAGGPTPRGSASIGGKSPGTRGRRRSRTSRWEASSAVTASAERRSACRRSTITCTLGSSA